MLNQIELKNIFKHTYSNIKFEPGINLIVGPNDSGKSSIVEAIAFALFLDTTKANKIEEIESDYGKPSQIKLLFNNNIVLVRGITDNSKDKLIEDGNETTVGRTNVTNRLMEILNFQKYFFMNIAYSPQDSLFSIIDMIPSEREKIINRILSLDYIDQIGNIMSKYIHSISNIIAENKFILKKMELSSEKRKTELLKELKNIESVYKEKNKIRDNLKQQHDLYLAYELFGRKRELMESYLKLKNILQDISLKRIKIEGFKASLEELIKLKDSITFEIKYLNQQATNIQEVIENGICDKCMRKVQTEDLEIFEKELRDINTHIQNKNKDLDKIKEAINETKNIITSIKSSIKYKTEKVRVKMLEARKEFLKLPNFRNLKKILTWGPKPEKDTLMDIEKLDELINEVNDTIKRIKWEYNELLSKQIKKERENISSRLKQLQSKQRKLLKIKKIIQEEKLASNIRALVIKSLQVEKIYSIFDVGTMKITSKLDIIINNKPIRLASGAQKVACALSLRLAMLKLYGVNFIILDEPTIYLDDIRIQYLKDMLKTIVDEQIIDQIILITHDKRFKEVANNIIEVSSKLNGESEVVVKGGICGTQ